MFASVTDLLGHVHTLLNLDELGHESSYVLTGLDGLESALLLWLLLDVRLHNVVALLDPLRTKI